jgi:hypothetical protein
MECGDVWRKDGRYSAAGRILIDDYYSALSDHKVTEGTLFTSEPRREYPPLTATVYETEKICVDYEDGLYCVSTEEKPYTCDFERDYSSLIPLAFDTERFCIDWDDASIFSAMPPLPPWAHRYTKYINHPRTLFTIFANGTEVSKHPSRACKVGSFAVFT